jgi:acyl carrier protein
MEIPQKLKDYIDRNRVPLPPIKDQDEPLHLDSLGVLRLIAFLDNDCGIKIEDEELVVTSRLCERLAPSWRPSPLPVRFKLDTARFSDRLPTRADSPKLNVLIRLEPKKR